MPITGTQTVAAQAMIAAENGVTARWRQIAESRGGPLNESEIAQMKQEVRAAGLAALFAHLLVNVTVVGVATGAMAGGPGVPVAGTIT